MAADVFTSILELLWTQYKGKRNYFVGLINIYYREKLNGHELKDFSWKK